ncbi:hypothetical protein ACFVWP_03740 [Streptomyces sp. NPDC058175]|uniref:hypothetical protein n=1 Tax=Streptomyces sp. NPDC058175 TaxID=3346367 RepID=UPI0036EF10C5
MTLLAGCSEGDAREDRTADPAPRVPAGRGAGERGLGDFDREKVSVYALITQDRFTVENPSAVWMGGRAMFTMVMSRTTISWHEQMTSGAIPLPWPRSGTSAGFEGVDRVPGMGKGCTSVPR